MGWFPIVVAILLALQTLLLCYIAVRIEMLLTARGAANAVGVIVQKMEELSLDTRDTIRTVKSR